MRKKNFYLKTAIIDGDVIIWIAVNGKKSYGAGGEALRQENGNLLYTDKTLKEATDTCDSYIKDILAVTQADSFILYLTPSKNFRHEIDKEYKGNRVSIVKPMWYQEVKEHLVSNWGGVMISGLEADDLCVLTLNILENSFIISPDKDIIKCIPGNHFKSVKGISSWVEVNKEEADYNFAKSMLVGDSIDGIHNIKPGYGPKTAEKDLDAVLALGVTPLTAVFGIYRRELGEYQGIMRFHKQYQLLKILDNIEQLPKGISFTLPEIQCWNCIEAYFSTDEFQLEYAKIEEL